MTDAGALDEQLNKLNAKSNYSLNLETNAAVKGAI